MRFKRAYDISVLLGSENADYPGDDPYTREAMSSISDGAAYNLSTLTLSAHSGTHIDAPAHFFEKARTLTNIPPRFYTSCPRDLCRKRRIDQARISRRIEDRKGRRPALQDCELHEWVKIRSGLFSEKFVYLSEEASEICLNLRAWLVGIDYISVDRYGDDDAPVHQKLLKEGILILEGINLIDVPSGIIP